MTKSLAPCAILCVMSLAISLRKLTSQHRHPQSPFPDSSAQLPHDVAQAALCGILLLEWSPINGRSIFYRGNHGVVILSHHVTFDHSCGPLQIAFEAGCPKSPFKCACAKQLFGPGLDLFWYICCLSFHSIFYFRTHFCSSGFLLLLLTVFFPIAIHIYILLLLPVFFPSAIHRFMLLQLAVFFPFLLLCFSSCD